MHAVVPVGTCADGLGCHLWQPFPRSAVICHVTCFLEVMYVYGFFGKLRMGNAIILRQGNKSANAVFFDTANWWHTAVPASFLVTAADE